MSAARARTLFLWDIDGTLLRTNGAGVRAMRKTVDALFGTGFNWEGILVSGGLDPIIFAELLTANGRTFCDDDHIRFRDHYIGLLQVELTASAHALERMPGIELALATLHRRARETGDVMQGLVTGNYGAAAALKFRACGIDSENFVLAAYGDEGKTRPDLVGLAMRRYQAITGHAADPRRTIIIGDTPRDIACAHAHGCLAFSVATGEYTVEQLHAAGADAVAKNLADPSPLYELAGID
jgi:phosphoglycolate phosphatase-like HAD superfamily hydrolase